MKALRFFFLSLLATFAFAASAQTIEVYKDGRVIDSFSAAQVDSVVYAPAAAEPRYYYYAGWDCPTSVEELEEWALTKTYPDDIDSQIMNRAGGEVTDFNSFSFDYSTNCLFDQQCWDEYDVTGIADRQYFVAIPHKSDTEYLQIYANGFNTVISEENGRTFKKYKVIGNYIIYQSVPTSLYINAITIKK